MSRLFATVFILLGALALPASAQQTRSHLNANDGTLFIQTLADRSLAIVRSPLKRVDKLQHFSMLYRENFDGVEILKVIAAPPPQEWSATTSARKMEASDRLGIRISAILLEKLDVYASHPAIELKVLGYETNGSYIVVRSQIMNPSKSEYYNIDWWLHKNERGMFMITDVKIEGRSLSQGQRQVFRSEVTQTLIDSFGGKLGAFMHVLERELKKLVPRTLAVRG